MTNMRIVFDLAYQLFNRDNLLLEILEPLGRLCKAMRILSILDYVDTLNDCEIQAFTAL